MGITVHPTNNIANSHKVPDESQEHSTTAHYLLKNSYRYVHNEKFNWLQLYSSSFSKAWHDSTFVATNNGLIDTVLKAYSDHHHLILRPDDLWLAILTQFSLFVNANAESLRSSFVSRDGKEKISIDITNDMDGSELSSIRIGIVSSRLTQAVHEWIKDPSIREWMLPNFTTTKLADKTAAAIVMLSTFKSYFDYELEVKCGLPSVTLEGEKSDYQSILRRIEKLKEYGVLCTAWYHLLRPVLKRIVDSFDDPESEENKEFWNHIVSKYARGSFPSRFFGWLTAFCVFGRDGNWIGPELDLSTGTDVDHAYLTPKEFVSKYLKPSQDEDKLVLDEIYYPTISFEELTPGCVEVDVNIKYGDVVIRACMMAGSCGYRIESSDDNEHDNDEWDTLKPLSGWWMYEKKA